MSGKLYVTNFEDNSVSVIDTTTDAVIQSLSTGPGPVSPTVLSSNLYVYNQTNKTFSIVPNAFPILQSLDTKEKSGSYGIGQNITINAAFNRKLLAGSVMEITLNNGAKVSLNTVENNILSGIYPIQSGQEKDLLTVLSLDSAKIIDFTGVENSTYTIPSKKNIGDLKKIIITNSTNSG